MSFSRPPTRSIKRAIRMLEPWRILTAPKVFGMENVPDERPLLFVGNHTIFGILDVPMMFRALLLEKDIFLRSLGDHLHFKIPVWREMIARYGVVDGTRKNCAALMDAGECILVFPGGAREVAKRKDEKYRLIWKERVGFVRMAVRHGCTIVPFSAVGAEDAYDILLDANDIMATPLGPLIKKLKLRDATLLPIATGVGPTPFPRPHRLYFRFGTPISTQPFKGQDADTALCHQIREQVRKEVEEGIEWLLETRESDPKREFLPRVLSELNKLAEQAAERSQ
ncbi:MAG: acyltransferase family protein [Myxococcales bacterium]|nr:acyltransferase family protein [Myxococcales bacterium]